MVAESDYEFVVKHCDDLNRAATSLGCQLNDAFMALAFMALPVIPELKITDKGVFDTNKFEFINIFDGKTVEV